MRSYLLLNIATFGHCNGHSFIFNFLGSILKFPAFFDARRRTMSAHFFFGSWSLTCVVRPGSVLIRQSGTKLGFQSERWWGVSNKKASDNEFKDRDNVTASTSTKQEAQKKDIGIGNIQNSYLLSSQYSRILYVGRISHSYRKFK